jgi:MoaA/NifB/PqqE/SkfB family radical SAM enzyme
VNLFQFTSARKLAYHRDWLDAYKRGEIVAPISVEMDLTNNCNYGCPNCVWGEFIAGSRVGVPREVAFRQIRECASIGVKALAFSGGGEPLLSPILVDCIRLAKEQGLQVGLFTNGLPLTPERAAVIRECCDWVRIHLDAVSADGYERRHRTSRDHLAALEKNVRQLSGQDSCVVGLGSVLNPDNISELVGLVDFAYRTSCKFFQAKHDFELLAQPWYTAWWSEQVTLVLSGMEKAGSYGTMTLQYTDADYARKPTATKCHIHHLTTAINASSEYVYCKRLRDKPEWSAGNLRDAPLRDILSGPKNSELSADVTPQNCGINCPYIELNELIDEVVRGNSDLPAADDKSPVHEHFF